MPRPRHQQGWVEEVGKQVKKWRGHYYVYLRREDGSEQRCHKTVTLGPKARLRKREAEQKLRQLIPGQVPALPQAGPQQGLTCGWFWRNRYLPVRPSWSGPTPDSVRYVMNRQVLPASHSGAPQRSGRALQPVGGREGLHRHQGSPAGGCWAAAAGL
jgi:hypothetical protein